MQGSLGNMAALELTLAATTQMQESDRRGPLHLLLFFRSQRILLFFPFWFLGSGDAVGKNHGNQAAMRDDPPRLGPRVSYNPGMIGLPTLGTAY